MTLFFNIFFPFLLVFFVLIALKPLIKFLKTNKIVDIPNDRSNHEVVIPKGAGIVLIPILSISIIFYSYCGFINKVPWVSLSLLMLIVCFFSFYDDMKNLSSAKKLIFQIIIVFLGINFFDKQLSIFLLKNFQIGEIYFNQNIIRIILFIFLSILWMWVMNLFNFMDGIDGITAVQVVFFSIGIIILSLMEVIDRQFTYIGILLFSVFLGFLYWNVSPSKIFIGDSGSISIGFFVGSIIVSSFINEKGFISICLLIVYYLSDSSITLIRRAFEKKNIFLAHSEHFYQKKVRSGFSHNYVLKYTIFVNILLLLFSILYTKLGILTVLLALLTVLIFLFWLSKGRYKKND